MMPVTNLESFSKKERKCNDLQGNYQKQDCNTKRRTIKLDRLLLEETAVLV